MTQIKQGESITITGVIKDDAGVVVADYTNKKLSVILMGVKQNILDSWSNGEGALTNLIISPEGIISFGVDGAATESMLGEYFLEFKITDGTVLVGRQLIQLQVLNSKIGREANL